MITELSPAGFILSWFVEVCFSVLLRQRLLHLPLPNIQLAASTAYSCGLDTVAGYPPVSETVLCPMPLPLKHSFVSFCSLFISWSFINSISVYLFINGHGSPKA